MFNFIFSVKSLPEAPCRSCEVSRRSRGESRAEAVRSGVSTPLSGSPQFTF